MLLGTWQQLAMLDLIDLSTEFLNYTFSSLVQDLSIILDHFTSIALVATASINCVSLTQSLALFQLALQLPLCTFSPQLALTIAYSVILAYFLCAWPSLTKFCALIDQILKFSHITSYLLDSLSDSI